MSGDGFTPTDSDGVPWEFAWMPWVGVIDERGKAQKIPTRGKWEQTLPGEWQVPDTYFDTTALNDDPEELGKYKQLTRPGEGKWRPDWEAGWVCKQSTGLWAVDVDDPEAFRRRMEMLGIEPPRTWAQSTGRVGGGTHLLFDGRDLPEQYWRQGGLGDPVWGDLKCAGFIAAVGARHPRGPVYTWLPDSGTVLVKPSLEFAEAILAERGLWKETLRDQGKGGGGGATGHRNVSSMTGQNRNVRLCSLLGTLINLGYEGDALREALIAANAEYDDPLGMDEMEDTILKPKPNFVRHPGADGADGLEVPEPLTDITTPWLPRDPAAASTGLDHDGRVPMKGDAKSDDNPHDVLRLAWAVALGYASPHVATLGRDLVVVSGAEGGSLDISDLDARRLRNLCASANLTYRRHIEKTTEKDEEGNETEHVEEWEEPSLPTMQLCATALADPAIRLYRPMLAAITRVPVLRPDRTLLERQGVDEDTRMIYWPDLPVGTIPVDPDRSEVAAARKFLIDELLADFPWSSDADQANCLAMLLTSFLEPYAEFLSPLFVLDALKSGSGKTFLARLLLETAGAHFRTWVNDEAEIRKSLTACLMESDRSIIFDDVDRKDTVSSATLSSALTKRRWDDRVLGVSKNFRGTNNRTWVLTGNNVKLGGDIPSRSVLISLNPGAVDPKTREVAKFALGDLDVWLGRDENKIQVIRALLTLVMAWASHGCRRSDVHHRFAEWAAVVGGVLEHAGVKDFLGNQAKVEEHVHHDESLADFFKRWFELYEDNPQQVTQLRATLGEIPEAGDGKVWLGNWPRNRKHALVTARGLASLLRDAIGLDHGGYQVDSKTDVHGHDLFYVRQIVVTEGESSVTTLCDATKSDQNPTT